VLICCPAALNRAAGICTRPLSVVESVVELATKLKRGFLADNEVLEHRQVPLVLSRASIHIPRGVPDIAQRWERENARSKPLGLISGAVSELRIAGDIDSLSVAPADQVGAAYRAETDARGAPLAKVVAPTRSNAPARC